MTPNFPEHYEAEVWPHISHAIDVLLKLNPGDYIPLSYEQCYSHVYRCVCHQMSERLYNDLLTKLRSYLEVMDLELLEITDQQLLLEKFNAIVHHYLGACNGIIPIFNYMNRYYVRQKLETDLETVLFELICREFIDKYINSVLDILQFKCDVPFAVSPQLSTNLLSNLHKVDKDYSTKRPDLFASLIVLPPSSSACNEEHMPHDLNEADRIQQQIISVNSTSTRADNLSSEVNQTVTNSHGIRLPRKRRYDEIFAERNGPSSYSVSPIRPSTAPVDMTTKLDTPEASSSSSSYQDASNTSATIFDDDSMS